MRPTRISATEWVSVDPAQVERRVRVFGPRMLDTQFFSHITAASLWGIPLPSFGTGEPVHISVLSPQPRPRANGIAGHELDGKVTRLVSIDGIRVSDAASTWCQLAGMLALPDLVAVADYLLTREGEEGPLLSFDELAEAVEERRGHRGAGQLRDALELTRLGSTSRVESVLRVLLHLAALPVGSPTEPATNCRQSCQQGTVPAPVGPLGGGARRAQRPVPAAQAPAPPVRFFASIPPRAAVVLRPWLPSP